MWQVLLAAAVAGSTGFVARHLFSPAADDPSKILGSGRAPDQEASEPSTPRATIRALSACESSCGKSEDIFRFSSSGSAGARSKGAGKNCSPRPAAQGAEVRRSGGNTGALHQKSGRKFHICLKRRKTGKNTAPKCGSCSSKENSLFNYGLGVGIMYMMSAGKAEISKLNTAIDETANVVKELKTELHRRKSSQNTQIMSSAKEFYGGSRRPMSKSIVLGNKLTENVEPIDTQMSFLPVVDDGEYASSVLTEEPEREAMMGMNQLEAELEYELEKLPWSIGDASCETQPYLAETEVPPISCQFEGVPPLELNQKLSHVLIEQQESQITELETELNSSQSKLREKEAELQALKDCVKRLTEFSISNGSDEETEAHGWEEWTGNWDGSNGLGSDDSESKGRMVGMKRPIDS